MRKIPPELENPIDNVLIDACRPVSALLHKMGWTPNDITFTSLLFGLSAIYYLLTGRFLAAAFFYLISYWMDCLYGFTARRYHQETEFGDKFDHWRDVLVNVSVYGIILYYYFKKSVVLGIIVLLVLLMLYCSSMVHLGCQELAHSGVKSTFLSALGSICPNSSHPDQAMRTTRYLGCGSLVTVTLGLIVALRWV